ncbi:unnamed protein product [Penicillium salamii]|nr:unnamed protein product [Penicillium salamii]
MVSSSSTILIEDDELPPSWRSSNSQVQRTSPRTSLNILIEPNDATSGSIEPSPKRKRAKRKQPNTLDTYFKKLRKTFDQRDQEVENLEQEVEKQQKLVQELQSKLLLQEDRHREELSRRRILDCKICYEQPDCWHILLCGHIIYEPCTERLDQNACPLYRASFSGFIKCCPFAG